MAVDTPDKEMEKVALEHENVKKFIKGKKILNVVVIPNRLVNIVVK